MNSSEGLVVMVVGSGECSGGPEAVAGHRGPLAEGSSWCCGNPPVLALSSWHRELQALGIGDPYPRSRQECG